MKCFITVTGTNYRYGVNWCERKMILKLIKEPENEYDKEAIRVEAEGLGTIGYVANSVKTVIGETMSAGRLYDRIGDIAYAEVAYVLKDALVCLVEDECILYCPPTQCSDKA